MFIKRVYMRRYYLWQSRAFFRRCIHTSKTSISGMNKQAGYILEKTERNEQIRAKNKQIIQAHT